ncbi:unnamed protein product [Caenorhabditis auriculariae]|uniref:Uncharacterized protein n=1 Tax=Caenorhabditis auriculariae TaxID=2777116 RepID=A0A8S1H375_9PELO|nr:unnamed protein product [Caenorhabditis auriculariae]
MAKFLLTLFLVLFSMAHAANQTTRSVHHLRNVTEAISKKSIKTDQIVNFMPDWAFYAVIIGGPILYSAFCLCPLIWCCLLWKVSPV